MKKDAMTMMELQYELGECLRSIKRSNGEAEREIAIEDARITTSLAKQFINGGKFILEAEKLQAQIGTLTESKAHAIIGD